MYGIVRSLRIKKPSLLIWTSREEDLVVLWQDPRSPVRQIFHWHKYISPLGGMDSPGASEVLYRRLEKAGSKKPSSIISEQLAQGIAVLAEGNIREFIRFIKEILKEGAKSKAKLPIEEQYAISTVLNYHKELNLSSFEYLVLKYLKDAPSSSSDKGIQEVLGLKETQARDRLKALEGKKLVFALEEKYGKLLYKPTEKSLLLMKYH
jgi:hypothetical protein